MEDDAEAKLRAEFLHRHNAPKDWLILTQGEVQHFKQLVEWTKKANAALNPPTQS